MNDILIIFSIVNIKLKANILESGYKDQHYICCCEKTELKQRKVLERIFKEGGIYAYEKTLYIYPQKCIKI